MSKYHELIEFDNGAKCLVRYLTDDKLEDANTFWHLDSPAKPSRNITDKYFHNLIDLEDYVNSFDSDVVKQGILFQSLEAIQHKFST